MRRIDPAEALEKARLIQPESSRQPVSMMPTVEDIDYLREERHARTANNLGSRYKNADLSGAPDIVTLFVKERGKSLYIYGPVGTGKTYLAAGISNEAKTRTMAISVPRLLFDLRNSFRNDRGEEDEIISKYSHTELLILDDLGAEKTTDYTVQSLYLIINERYRNDLPLVVTSNLSLQELAEKLDDRIASRLKEMCEIVKLEGKDRRLE